MSTMSVSTSVSQSLIKSGLSLCAPGGRYGRLQILIYHRVLLQPDFMRPWEITKDKFIMHMEVLKKYFHVLSLSEGLDRLHKQTLPGRAVAITFDDGYEDNYSVALPILKAYQFPAAFFIATGYLDNGNMMWNDRVIESLRGIQYPEIDLSSIGLGIYQLSDLSKRAQAAVDIIKKIKHYPSPKRMESVATLDQFNSKTFQHLMMTQNQIKELYRHGMEIGAHTVSHPILANIQSDEAVKEIGHSKEILEAITGQPVKYFAYPNGFPKRDYTLAHCELVKKIGFKAACSTWWGAASRYHDLYQLPRFTPWDLNPLKFLLRMAQYRLHSKGCAIQ